ncbi:hypothetical protein CRG98_032047, partial [Punica granatum]
NFERNHTYIAPSYDEEESSSGNRFKMKLKEFHRNAASFTALDRNYLTPFFTSHNGDMDDDDFDDQTPPSSRSGFRGHG